MSLSLRRLDAGLPIGIKLALPLVFLAVAGGGLLAVTYYRSEANHIREDYEDRGFLIGQDVRGAVAAQRVNGAMLGDYPGGVQRHIDALIAIQPSILRINVYQVRGSELLTIASTDHGAIGSVNADAGDLQAVEESQTVSHDDDVDDVPALEVAVPFRLAGAAPFTVGVYISSAERDQALAALLRNFIIGILASAVTLIAVLVAGVRLLIFRRVKLVLTATGRLQSGDFTARVEHAALDHPRDEMLRLAARFNGMAAAIQELHEQVEVAATTDPLTGLYNRRFVMEALDREIARARRGGEPLAVIMADVDGLKQINDRLGHGGGDHAIRHIATALAESVRHSDYAARFGGDEFVAVLPGCSEDMLAAILERMRVAATVYPNGEPAATTVSAGGAILRAGDDTAALLARADDALYAAKRAGKNQVHLAA
ncbi:MAG: GGDEF domain-containing protein [Chloroflexi bacterium]|nr:GGDEF domain-containing protein [Chloroflexota bacterium]